MPLARTAFFAQDSSIPGSFTKQFNSEAFLFRHQLHLNELFSLPNLKTLAEKLAKEKHPRGFLKVPKGSRILPWGSPAFVKALAEGFDNIETSGIRLKLSYIHLEPEYGELFRECCTEIDELTSGLLTRDFHSPRATLFISSPHELTPYHVDSEVNFLCQLSGEKIVYLFDGNDPDLVNPRSLEQYWGTGRIEFREEFRSRARPFQLSPGLGVHHPVHFPHMVHNGPRPSVSLSLALTHVLEPSDIFQINYHLRRFGVRPKPPGQNQRIDAAKCATARLVRSVKRAVRFQRGPDLKLR